MSDDYRLICLGLVPRKSLGVKNYSIALLLPNPMTSTTGSRDGRPGNERRAS